MRRIQHATRVIDANGEGKDGFGEGEVARQIPPTVITAQFLNDLQEEFCNAVESAGLVLSSDTSQLAQAIAIAATGSSSANAISIQGRGVLSNAPASDDVLGFNGATWGPGKIRNQNIAATAAIDVSKLAPSIPDSSIYISSAGTPTYGPRGQYHANLNGGTHNDYAISNLSSAQCVFFANTGNNTITGFAAPPSTTGFRAAVLGFGGSGSVTFSYNSGLSAPGNRIFFANASELTKTGPFVALLMYVVTGWYLAA